MLSLVLAVTLSQAPLGVGQVPTSSLPSFPPASWPQHIFIDSTKKCFMYSDGVTWKCLVEEGDAATSSNGLRSLPSAPSAPATGDTYYDSTKGCLQTWTGVAWVPSACPITSAPSVPAVPQILYPPAASAPTGTIPAGGIYVDTTLGCARRHNGTAWGECLTTQRCTGISVSGLSIPLAGITTTSTVTFSGALAGRDCTMTPPSFLPLGAKAVCRVTSANTVEYRWEAGGLLAVALAIPSGTHTLCTEVLW